MPGRISRTGTLLAAAVQTLLFCACASGPPSPNPASLRAAWKLGLAEQGRRLERLAPTRGDGTKAEDASLHGFSPADATAALQAAIDSGARTVLVPDTGSPWLLSTTIRLRSDLELIFAPGVRIEAAPGAFRGAGETLFEALDATNLRISGYGATWAMRGPDYRRDPYEDSQWRHALSLRGVREVLVEGLRIEDSGGDGVYLGSLPGEEGQPRRPCEEVTLRNLELLRHHRQGISVVAARGLRIEDCLIADTGGTLPGAGIDFEPNSLDEAPLDCLVEGCLVEGNSGPALLLALGRLPPGAAPADILLRGCRFRGAPVALGLGPGTLEAGGMLRFEACSWSGLRLAGPREGPGLRISFD